MFQAIRPSVMSTISKKKAPPITEDPLMKLYNQDQASIDQSRQTKMGSDLITNLGQSFSQLAQGANTPKGNADLYAQMGKQNEELLKSKEHDSDRRSKVISAIQSRNLRDSITSGRRDYQKEKDDLKKSEKELSLAVPGYERTGQVLPKAEEAQKFRAATASAKQLVDKLTEMGDLVDQVGSFEYGGEKGQQMQSLATEIQLLSKNQDMYNLGVLTGPDMGLLTKITADPASLQSLFTRDSTRKAQIEAQLKSIKNKLESSGASMGYRQSPQGGVPASAEQNGKMVIKKLYSPSRNQTKVVYEDGSEEVLDGKG